MRLPMQGEEVDLAQTKQMVDAFLAQGFNYFDTAHGYIGGRSETALSPQGQATRAEVAAILHRFAENVAK